jgi:tRNA(Ile)-lysidine synthase
MSGIEPLLLNIKKSPADDKSTVKNIENKLRVKRYRTLASAAYKRGIRDLFLGHHSDDQVETLLMRLFKMTQPRTSVLQGMASTAPIPCCEDIDAINSEQGPVNAASMLGLPESAMSSPIGGVFQALKPGGLMLHRPLLSFSKDDLIATCQENDVRYALDHTNNDPTLTVRNAIRAMITQHVLPIALQKKSIIDLSDRARAVRTALNDESTSFLRSVSMRKLDLSSGFLEVHIPETFAQLVESHRPVAARVVDRITSIIDPAPDSFWRTRVKSGTLDQIGSYISGESRSDMSTHDLGKLHSRPVTFHDSHILFQGRERGPEGAIMRISRAPIHSNAKSSIRFRQTNAPVPEAVLWDFRYWLRIRTSHDRIRAAMAVDRYLDNNFGSMADYMNNFEKKTLSRLLQKHAPGNVRNTLPVLTLNNRIVAFPTISKEILVLKAFNQGLRELGLGGKGSVLWEVWFKVIHEPTNEWVKDSTSLFEATNTPVSKSLRSPDYYQYRKPYRPPRQADSLAPS